TIFRSDGARFARHVTRARPPPRSRTPRQDQKAGSRLATRLAPAVRHPLAPHPACKATFRIRCSEASSVRELQLPGKEANQRFRGDVGAERRGCLAATFSEL